MSSSRMLDSILRRECSHLGTSFDHTSAFRVVVRPSGKPLFAKLDDHVEQTLGEAHSLLAMEGALPGKDSDPEARLTPKVHAFGSTSDGSKAYLVTDYLDLQPSLARETQKKLGRSLAEMHKGGTSKDGQFGFHVATYCGVTRQDNTWETSWMTFWAEHRIGDLVNRIHASQSDPQLKELEEQMRQRVYPVLLEPLEGKVKPCILHGDLWSGNAGTITSSGQPAIFESSYYGHNEAELGIMHMFGGFSKDFFDAYHEVMPRSEPHYAERLRLYELYHHLNHLLMFRGGYRSGAVSIMRSLIDFCDQVTSAE